VFDQPIDFIAENAMHTIILDDADAAARRAAAFIADEARTAVEARGRFVLAVSGGTTPWKMLRYLANESLPWASVYVAQVDERVAPEGHPDRNLTHLRESLISNTAIQQDHIIAMPVSDVDLESGGARYAKKLETIAGSPLVLDLVHLGLGPDGHTASLVPGDPVLGVTDRDVAVTNEYQGRRRLTLTYPVLNRARRILWLVTGAEKAGMLVRLTASDPAIPAGRVRQENAAIIADREAGSKLPV
jgi:6-phosphogluconolactonase